MITGVFKAIGCSVVVVVGVISIAVLVINPRIPITVTQAQIDSALAASLPMTVENLAFEAVIKTIDVATRDDGKIAIDAEMSFEGLSLHGSAAVEANTSLRYARRKLFLSDISSENVAVTMTPDSVAALQTYRDAARTFLSRRADEIGEEETDLTQEAEARISRAAKAALDQMLKETPVYRWTDDRWWVRFASLSVAEIKIREGIATVVLEPSRLVTIALVWLAVGAFYLLKFWAFVRDVLKAVRRFGMAFRRRRSPEE